MKKVYKSERITMWIVVTFNKASAETDCLKNGIVHGASACNTSQ
jgi:hypothetical protein